MAWALTASIPPAPTAVPAAWASLGTASPVKVSSGEGDGQEGPKRAAMGLDSEVTAIVSWFPDSHGPP